MLPLSATGESPGVPPAAAEPQNIVTCGKLRINFLTRTVLVDGRFVHVPDMEYSILELLAKRKGLATSREIILNYLYLERDKPDARIVDVFVCRLRKRLVEAAGGERCIFTLHRLGYVLRDPSERNVWPRRRAGNTARPFVPSDQDMICGQLTVQLKGKIAAMGGRWFCMSNAEFEVLHQLALSYGEKVTVQSIRTALGFSEVNIRNIIHRLRLKFRGLSPEACIHTANGAGAYVLRVPRAPEA
ncbi:MAG TPA: winged helix-turn-helix domain-containing protein [Candidatus Paceibacterota bacterium]|nr:winged helix-turn-helix domain-containing protein [Candidatus Paceibacterota bacterium]